MGICTDVIIRSYRVLGYDLQQLAHDDMHANFNVFPQNWGLVKLDTNIDHRRVPNLQCFFKHHDAELTISENASDYHPGDLVTWNLAKPYSLSLAGNCNIPHIGIVTNKKVPNSNRYYIAHNIGNGPDLEDILFGYGITGHYRYIPKASGLDYLTRCYCRCPSPLEVIPT